MWARWLERTLNRTHAAEGAVAQPDPVGQAAGAVDDLTPTCPSAPAVSPQILTPNRQTRLTPMAGAAGVCA